MFYCFDNEIVGVPYNNISDNDLCIGYVNVSELEEIYNHFSFSCRSVEKCKEKNGLLYSDMEVSDDYSFVRLNTVGAKISSGGSSLALYIKKNLLLIVSIADNGNQNRDVFLNLLSKASPEKATLEKLVASFFELLIAGDSMALEQAEQEINTLEEMVIKNQADKSFNMQLLNMKKELLNLRGYYEQLIDVSQTLQENENEIFDGELLKSFHIFTEKTIRLKDNVDLLRDSVVHLWDAYQAYLDMRLNQTMKIFTLVTTVFFPMTVIVGWYGMNFDYMPELKWRYGYAYVIVLSIVVVVGLFLWFKKKKWF